MAASLGRSTWKGHLRVSLVSIPVKAYTAATSGGGEIHPNQLHRDCHHRIRYRKTCPVHGEVSGEEIVSGYEYAQGQSVVIRPEELDRREGQLPGPRSLRDHRDFLNQQTMSENESSPERNWLVS